MKKENKSQKENVHGIKCQDGGTEMQKRQDTEKFKYSPHIIIHNFLVQVLKMNQTMSSWRLLLTRRWMMIMQGRSNEVDLHPDDCFDGPVKQKKMRKIIFNVFCTYYLRKQHNIFKSLQKSIRRNEKCPLQILISTQFRFFFRSSSTPSKIENVNTGYSLQT